MTESGNSAIPPLVTGDNLGIANDQITSPEKSISSYGTVVSTDIADANQTKSTAKRGKCTC